MVFSTCSETTCCPFSSGKSFTFWSNRDRTRHDTCKRRALVSDHKIKRRIHLRSPPRYEQIVRHVVWLFRHDWCTILSSGWTSFSIAKFGGSKSPPSLRDGIQNLARAGDPSFEIFQKPSLSSENEGSWHADQRLVAASVSNVLYGIYANSQKYTNRWKIVEESTFSVERETGSCTNEAYTACSLGVHFC